MGWMGFVQVSGRKAKGGRGPKPGKARLGDLVLLLRFMNASVGSLIRQEANYSLLARVKLSPARPYTPPWEKNNNSKTHPSRRHNSVVPHS
jgi:hypothetical protein